MANFEESMKAFTGRLKASIDDRTDSLADMRQATNDLIDAARMFMDSVAIEHDARAEAINAFMAKSHADRHTYVSNMREMHRDELAAMSESMHEMLDENMKERNEYVRDFMSTSREDRLTASKAMRDAHREQLAMMSEQLRESLDEANRDRMETVGAMRDTFQTAQKALASDLKAASMTWRTFAASR